MCPPFECHTPAQLGQPRLDLAIVDESLSHHDVAGRVALVCGDRLPAGLLGAFGVVFQKTQAASNGPSHREVRLGLECRVDQSSNFVSSTLLGVLLFQACQDVRQPGLDQRVVGFDVEGLAVAILRGLQGSGRVTSLFVALCLLEVPPRIHVRDRGRFVWRRGP